MICISGSRHYRDSSMTYFEKKVPELVLNIRKTIQYACIVTYLPIKYLNVNLSFLSIHPPPQSNFMAISRFIFLKYFIHFTNFIARSYHSYSINKRKNLYGLLKITNFRNFISKLSETKNYR